VVLPLRGLACEPAEHDLAQAYWDAGEEPCAPIVTRGKTMKQCCTCARWQPRYDDPEIGRCTAPMVPKSEEITLWSDGCNKWLSNQLEESPQ